MHRILYLAFALSGGAGLIYEAVWGRYLALFVGHAAYAQVLVIATYLGGMGLGAFLVGQRARAFRRPLLWYAGAEVALALLALGFHPLFQGLTGLAYDRMMPALEAGGILVGLGKWSLAVALVLPQALLLGTTFPLMSSGVLRSFRTETGRTLSLLYFTNSFGAAIGVLVGGFYLVGQFGLPGSLTVAAGLNVLAAGMAVWVWKVRGEDGSQMGEATSGPPARETEGGLPASPGLIRLLLATSFFTAVASFAYEIGWIRMLSLVMGSATHSFEVMLSAFILGLALGAYFVRTRADAGPESLTLLGWVQWFMGLAALATLPVYLSSFGTMAFLVDALPPTDGGYALFGLARYGIAIAVMLPSTIMAGMTLPLITTLLFQSGQGETAIGRVYGVNTFGSVLGVGAAGLIGLPVLGLKGLILAGAALDMLLGVVILLLHRDLAGSGTRRWGPVVALAGSLAALGAVQLGVHMDERLLLSGVFRYGAIPDPTEPVLFYEDGRTATVGVHMGRGQDLAVLTTNGKPDASISLRWIRAQGEPLPPRSIVFDDEATQTLLSLIPLAHAPGARTVAHIGHGSGLTGHATLASPNVEQAVTIEIEPVIIHASEAFYPANARVFEDPRSSFVIDDAKAYFAGGQVSYDLIISEPSNPWVSGTASLFTVEFYQRIRHYLAPGGLFAQWFHGYEMTDSLVASVLAGFHQVFPHYRGYQVGPGDLLLVASGDTPLTPPDWQVFEFPAVARMLAHVPPFTARHFQALHLFDRNTLSPILDDWKPVNSDFFPRLDMGAERARFKKSQARGFLGMGSERILLSAFMKGMPEGFSDDWSQPILGIDALESLSVGSWLRWSRGRELSQDAAPTGAHAHARALYAEYSEQVETGEPPPDWRRFMGLVGRVEQTLHGGTAGVADSLFYHRLVQYLDQADAPPEARAGARFLHGVASWDREETIRGGEILMEAARKGQDWVSRNLLREGMVLSLLALGDGEGARAVLEALPEPKPAPGLSVRMEILRGLVQRE